VPKVEIEAMKMIQVRALVKEMSIQLEVARTVQDSLKMNPSEISGANEELSLSVHCCSDLVVSDCEA